MLNEQDKEFDITFQKDDINFCYKLGRCKNFWVDKVGCNSRCECCKIHKDKRLHLFAALKKFTDEKFNTDDWDVINPNNIHEKREFEVDGSKERCFCSQTIHKLSYAVHKPTRRVILIGSECIRKFQGKEKGKIANGKACKFCDKWIDGRKKYCRDGMCFECAVSQPDYNYTLNFGKYKNSTVREVYRKDKRYFQWLHNTCLEIQEYNKRFTEELVKHVNTFCNT